MENFEKVEVFWEDAGLEAMHLDIPCAKEIKAMPRSNAGYLLENTKDKVVLVFGFIEDADKNKTTCDQTLVIPKGMITKIKKLS